MYFRATRGIKQFLISFYDKEFSGKLAVAFEAQIQLRFNRAQQRAWKANLSA